MKNKRFWKYFIVIFIVVFFVINWSEISWIFNYRTVSSLVSDFSGRENKIEERVYHDSYEKEGTLEISKIEISVPLIFTETGDQKEIEESLDFGVVHFFDSSLPGQAGQTIILGHSAPPGWPRVKYDWVFTRINELTEGDEIIVYFNNERFDYLVKDKFFLERGEEVPQYSENSKNVLILISCWPPGKDLRRIAVEAELK